MSTVHALLLTVAPVGPDVLGGEVYDRFKAEQDTLIVPVVDAEGRPVGIVERNAFFLRMAAEFGRALYAKRPIHMVMDPDPLVVEAATPIADFMGRMLTERPSDLLRGFIVTDNGRYVGVGAGIGLLQHAHQQAQRGMAKLAEAAERLTFANAEARQAQAFMTTVVESMPAMVFVKRADDHSYMLFNKAGEDILGVDRHDVLGKRDTDFFAADLAAASEGRDREALESGKPVVVEESRLRHSDGSEVILRLRKIGVNDAAGRPQFIVGVGEDITDRRRAEAQIERLAHYDPLTGLPNRALFQKQFSDALARAGRSGEGAAVLCLDLDHFKTVNDTLGHNHGDLLLEMAAQRLQRCVRDGDTAARLGGDEFAVVQNGLASPDGAARLAARIVQTMAEPFEVEGHQVVVGASVGIALFDTDGRDAEDLLKKADMALYRVKREGRGGFHFFEPGMDENLQARRRLELDLRRALQAGEFEVHFQPLYDLAAERITGCEALVRWRHPERGMVGPVEFIPIAEETGLINQLGEWVLRQACADAANWPSDIRVAVNISAVQFRNPNFVQTVISALANAGLAAERLEVEITEGVLLQDSASNLEVLHRLRGLGVRISMDDFGTGYSSLSYLRSFPFDKIKIDQSFVRDLPRDAEALAIIQAVTGLGASLGIATTAEGVETQAQMDKLREYGCSEIQGYLISRPTPGAALLELLSGQTAHRPAGEPAVVLVAPSEAAPRRRRKAA